MGSLCSIDFLRGSAPIEFFFDTSLDDAGGKDSSTGETLSVDGTSGMSISFGTVGVFFKADFKGC